MNCISRATHTAESFCRKNAKPCYLIQHCRYECCRPDNSNYGLKKQEQMIDNKMYIQN